MMKKTYHFASSLQLIVTLMAVFVSIPAVAQQRLRLTRLHSPSDSVEQPVHMAIAKGSHKSSARHEAPAYPGDEYLMETYNMFDPETGDNIYTQGGKATSYSVYIQLDDATGEARITNIIDLPSPSTITGTWDKDAHTITIHTPISWSDPETECAVAGEQNDYQVLLQAGDAYGIGYWKLYDDLVMDVSSDRSTITPRQDLAGKLIMYDGEDIYEAGFSGAYFDSKLYKKAEGANIVTDKEELDFGRCFVGTTQEKTIRIMNTGTEQAEYVVEVQGDGLSVDNPSGTLASGAAGDIAVKFNPTKTGQFGGAVVVSADNGDKTVSVKANVEEYPNYAAITSEGSGIVAFTTSTDYPWLLTDTLDSKTVAVTTNAGQGNSESALTATVTVPDGKKVVASWDAVYDPRYGSYDEFHIDSDDNNLAVYDKQGRQEITGSTEMAPGIHDLTFSYQKGFQANSGAIVYGKDYVFLRDMKFHLVDYKKNDAKLSAENLDMRRFFLSLNDVQEADSSIYIKNEGSDSLVINGITNSRNFSATVAKNKLGEFESLPVKITFWANAVGNYDSNVVLNTSAGKFTIHCKAKVEAPYNYEPIVDEGDFFFMTDRDYPFVIDGNSTYNGNSDSADNSETYSALGCFFNVPEGKTGVLTWEGKADCSSTDYGLFAIDNGLTAKAVKGANADGSYRVATPALTYLKPGSHYVVFAFQTNGDGKIEGQNRYTISHLKLQLLDEVSGVKLWEGDSIEIPATYPGHYSVVTANVLNLSDGNMTIEGTEGAGAFSAKYNENGWNSASKYGVTDVKLIFTPTATGEQKNDVTINTNNGNVVVRCKAKALDDSKLICFDDFENNASGWQILDNDDDDVKWKTYAGNTGNYSDLGQGILMFNANFIDKGANDYIVSPELTIPDGGATLSFVRDARSARNHSVAYSVMVGEGSDPSTYSSVYTENDNPTSYQPVDIDLSDYAGKKVHVAFYTNAQPDSGLLQIDNFTVTAKVAEGIRATADSMKNRSAYYTIDGKRTDSNFKGLGIVKTVDGNGQSTIHKEIRR